VIKSFPVLYSLTSKGQTQTWRIETNGAKFRTVEGILDGALTTSDWTECAGKNGGKANETTGAEQATKEATSRHKKKLDSGYCEQVEDINKPKFFEPMLAKKWEDYKDEIVFPVYSQPKLDGQRCISNSTGLVSRNGKPILSAPHISEDLANYFAIHYNGIIDGELYCDKYKNDFNKIISLTKKTKPTAADLAESAKYIEYWVYDCWTYPNLPFIERTKLLENVVKLQTALNPNIRIKFVETTLCNNMDELDALFAQYLSDGFEGQMIRATDGLYENKRTKNLLKRKTFLDAEFELIDLEAGRGNAANHAARAILKTKSGVIFEAGLIGSHEYCAEILKNKNKLIGQMATVIYQNMTPGDNPVPRFGKMKALRNYE